MPSLGQRLGYAASEKLLIVNCDDFGSSHAANMAIVRALKEGLATSATLMVPCPWAREAARLCEAGKLDIGVHLTLTCEYPDYRWRALTAAKSLHDSDGFMPATAQDVWSNAGLDDVEAECVAQIEQALAWGVDVTHLDAHMGTMQIDPHYFAIYVKLARRFRLPLRMIGAKLDARLGNNVRAAAASADILFPDDFIMLPWGKPTLQAFRAAIPSIEAGVTEIFFHPVEDGTELRAYDRKEADTRAGDYVTVFDGEARRLLDAHAVRRISFRPLRELMRQGV